MPYIGKAPASGIRSRFIYTATAAQTTFTGADGNGKTLGYTDGEYVDVYLNGVLLDPSDYTATSKTSVVLDSGAAVSDIVEIVVYDTFSVFNGTFTGDLTVDGDTLYVDSTNNNVGIGTTSPSVPLHVKSDTGNATFVMEHTSPSTGTGQTSTFITGSSDVSVAYDDEGSYTIGTSSNPVTGAVFTSTLSIKSDGAITTGGASISVLSGASSVTLADDASYTISTNGTATGGACLLCVYEISSGDNALFHTGYNSSTILSTANNTYGFSVSDTDGKICIIKNAHNLTLKNRAGLSRTFKLALYGAGAENFNL